MFLLLVSTTSHQYPSSFAMSTTSKIGSWYANIMESALELLHPLKILVSAIFLALNVCPPLLFFLCLSPAALIFSCHSLTNSVVDASCLSLVLGRSLLLYASWYLQMRVMDVSTTSIGLGCFPHGWPDFCEARLSIGWWRSLARRPHAPC